MRCRGHAATLGRDLFNEPRGEPVAGIMNQIMPWYPDAVERQGRGRRGAVAHFVLRPHGFDGGRSFQPQGRYRLLRIVDLAPLPKEEVVRDVAVGNGLAAADQCHRRQV